MKPQIMLMLITFGLPLCLLAQKPGSVTLTNPGSPTIKSPDPKTPPFDPNKIPQVKLSCKMSNGQPRLFPCEFEIQSVVFLGKNNEVAGTITPANTTVKLPKSKAVNIIHSSSGDSYVYTISLNFTRIHKPSFSPKPFPLPGPKPLIGFYEIETSTVTDPISPSELSVVKKVNLGPDLPPSGSKPNQIQFPLQLNYSTGSEPSLFVPVRYIQIKNPITSTKFPNSVNRYRDRSEAWIAFSVGVDMAK